MTYYDYKVIPAPRRAKRIKGVSGAEELFALTLTEAINEVARQGWEYVARRAAAGRGAARLVRARAVAEEQTVLVFRRAARVARRRGWPRCAARARRRRAAARCPRRRGRCRDAERAAVDRLQARASAAASRR